MRGVHSAHRCFCRKGAVVGYGWIRHNIRAVVGLVLFASNGGALRDLLERLRICTRSVSVTVLVFALTYRAMC